MLGVSDGATYWTGRHIAPLVRCLFFFNIAVYLPHRHLAVTWCIASLTQHSALRAHVQVYVTQNRTDSPLTLAVVADSGT